MKLETKSIKFKHIGSLERIFKNVGGKKMERHEIGFSNGHLFCMQSQEGDEEDLLSTYEIYKRMRDYYRSKCLVKYSRPIKIGEWETIKTEMPVSEAMFYMKERMLPEMVIVEVYK